MSNRFVFAWCAIGFCMGLLIQLSVATCTSPASICVTDRTTGAPTDLDCLCPRPLSIGYDPNDPFSTTTGCPSCPLIPGSCPDLVPSHPSKALVCHRHDNDDNFSMIEISQHAVNAHLRHGDFVPTTDTCCICDVDLCEARKQTLAIKRQSRDMWYDPANLVNKTASFQTYLDLLTPILTEDYTFISVGVGKFGPRLIAMEYDLIVTPYIGDQVNFLYQQPYNISWSHNGTVLHWYTCERYLANVPNAFEASMSVYRGELTFRFVPNSAKLYESDDVSACVFRTPSGPPSPLLIGQICNTLAYICASVPTYQFNGNVSACEEFWSHLADKQSAILGGSCNYQYPGTSDTSQCRQTHFLSALVDPVVHCPHTNVVSEPCKDTLDDYPGATCAFYTGPAPA